MRGKDVAGTFAIVALSTVVAALMQPHFDLSNLAMVYLVGVVVAAIAFGRGPAMLTAFLSVATFDFVFVPPRFTLRVSDTQYLFTLGAMLLVGAVIGTLTAWLREQLDQSQQRERRTAALYRMSHDLAACTSPGDALRAAAERVGDVFEASVAASLPGADGRLVLAFGDASLLNGAGGAEDGPGGDRAEAQRAFDLGELAGLDTQAMVPPGILHVPLSVAARSLGVLSIRSRDPQGFRTAERVELLRALASHTALALERCRLDEVARQARFQAETERLRSALLSAVSHDLRTPLASITGAASSLRDDASLLSEDVRHELAATISEEAQRLDRLIGDLLDMTRLESGTLRVRKDWHSLEEVVGAALVRLEVRLGDRPVRVALAHDLPLVSLDDVLFEQLMWNLIENADKYSPRGAPVDVAARIADRELELTVADRGPGLARGDEQHVFEKFYRGRNAAGRAGVGLGLAICEGIARAHGGTIEAANRPDGGAVFTVRLPVDGAPPHVETDEEPSGGTPASRAG